MGDRLGDGPIVNIFRASASCALDGAGSFSIQCAATDKRAIELLQSERRVYLYTDAYSDKRLLTQGIIRKRSIDESAAGSRLIIGGPDVLDELKRRNSLIGRSFSQSTLSDICSTLIGLVPGWSIDVDSAIANNVLDLRLDGASILKAFQDLFPRYGYHIRLDPTAPKTLVVSRFGNASGYRAHAIRNFYEEALENEELVLVERINEEADTENLVNRIFLQGAGEGTAALTLNGSTRTTPYTIEDIVGPDLTSQYYIEDTTSIADYGVIEKYVQFKEIGALSNSSADVRNAANALYDAGVIHLSRYASPFEHYNVILRNVRQNLQVGDTLRLDYVAEIDTPDGKARYFDLEGDYWIMECRESIDANQIITSLRVASVDRMPDTPAKWVQDAIESVQARDLKPSVTGSIRSYVFPRQIDQHNGGKIPIEFTAASREVQRVRMRIRTRPLRGNVRATAANQVQSSAAGGSGTSASGGVHRHRMMQVYHGSQVGSIQGGEGWSRLQFASGENSFDARDSRFAIRGAAVVNGDLTNNPAEFWTEGQSVAHDHTIPSHRHDVPAHSHAIEYGLFDDTQTPYGLTVFINGRDRTAELYEMNIIANMTGAYIDATCLAGAFTNILYQEPGGLRQLHEIEIRCAGGQGEVEVVIEIYEQSQTIALPLDTVNVILTLPTDVPDVITTLTLTAGDSSATAEWNPVNLATHYDLQWRRRDVGDAWRLIENLTITSHVIPMLMNSIEYEVQVRAGNQMADPPPGDGVWSVSEYVSPVMATVPPTQPQNLALTAEAEAFSWVVDMLSGVSQYNVYWREDGTSDAYETQAFSENSGNVEDLDHNLTYEVYVTAENSAGESPATPTATVTPEISMPAGLATDVRISVEFDSNQLHEAWDSNFGSLVEGTASIISGNLNVTFNRFLYATANNNYLTQLYRTGSGFAAAVRAEIGSTHTLYVYHERRNRLYARELSSSGSDSNRLQWSHVYMGNYNDNDVIRLIIAESAQNAEVLAYIMDS